MGKRCIIQFCGNSNKTGHAYVNLRQQWTNFVQVKWADFVEPSKHSVICGAHFTLDCFEGSYMQEMGFKMLTDLIPSAVPKIQLQTPQQQSLRDLVFLAVLTHRSTEQSFELSFSVHVCFFLLSFIF